MFYDPIMLKIVQRSGNMNEEDIIGMLMQYTRMILASVGYSTLDFFVDEKEMNINTPKDIIRALDKFPKVYKQDKKLMQKINNDIDRINWEFLKFFLEHASPGDSLYMRIYLLSKVQDIKNKKIESYSELTGEINERDKNEDEDNKPKLSKIEQKETTDDIETPKQVTPKLTLENIKGK